MSLVASFGPQLSIVLPGRDLAPWIRRTLKESALRTSPMTIVSPCFMRWTTSLGVRNLAACWASGEGGVAAAAGGWKGSAASAPRAKPVRSIRAVDIGCLPKMKHRAEPFQ
ncbi:hypothetical protein D3C87_1687430 [compost metagenome]